MPDNKDRSCVGVRERFTKVALSPNNRLFSDDWRNGGIIVYGRHESTVQVGGFGTDLPTISWPILTGRLLRQLRG